MSAPRPLILGTTAARLGSVLAGLAVALLVAASTPTLAAGASASLPDIEDEVMCPICGTTLEGAGTAPQAERQRELIRRLIDEGESKDEIKAALVVEYGPDVLAVPDDSGFDLLAWVVPIVGFAIAVGGLALVLVRMRRQDPARAEVAPPPLSAEDRERVDRDLERHSS